MCDVLLLVPRCETKCDRWRGSKLVNKWRDVLYGEITREIIAHLPSRPM